MRNLVLDIVSFQAEILDRQSGMQDVMEREASIMKR